MPMPIISLGPSRWVVTLLLVVGLASCGTPTEKTGAGQSVTLPATAEGRDSVQASLTTPAPDAASTAADSTAARTAVTPR